MKKTVLYEYYDLSKYYSIYQNTTIYKEMLLHILQY